ncbi:MAG TPA: sulfite exporter TauE/SafE family protein [Gammaproteobacteria bacterium]|nr:sulfite exporter TauE/SafE family protein [Gammaproteobacteria bacterium]
MPDELLFIAVSLLAAFVHGAFGFGFPLLSTPLLLLGFDLRTAILLTLVPTVSINLVSILSEHHWRAALRDYWPIPAFTIVGSFLGTQVLLNVDPDPFRFLLAVMLIGYLVSDHLHRSEHVIRVPKWGMALFGLLLGLLAGVVNIFAPLVVAYALYTRMPVALMVATFNLSFITSKSGQIIGFVSQGAFDLGVVKLAVFALPLILGALWLGIRVRKRVDMATYRGMLRGSLWVISVAILLDALRRMLFD